MVLNECGMSCELMGVTSAERNSRHGWGFLVGQTTIGADVRNQRVGVRVRTRHRDRRGLKELCLRRTPNVRGVDRPMPLGTSHCDVYSMDDEAGRTDCAGGWLVTAANINSHYILRHTTYDIRIAGKSAVAFVASFVCDDDNDTRMMMMPTFRATIS
jgi:hypothetical protein